MNLRNFIFDKDERFWTLAAHGFYKNMNDAEYLMHLYKTFMKQELNLTDPKTYNEKIQWLKINNHNPQLASFVDKYEAKEKIKELLPNGEQYIIPTIGIYDEFKDIDISSLPNQFVMKCTHDSGGLSICRNKDDFDFNNAKSKLEKSLKNNFYYRFREWAYKNVKPRILIESYMQNGENRELTDYKFFCFNGEPQFLYVSEGLENHSTAKISFCDFDGKQLPFCREDYKPFEGNIPLPSNIDEMIKISRNMAAIAPAPFVRVDLYNIESNIYFSEFTFYPNGGFIPFNPKEADYELGKLLNLHIDDEG